MTDRPAVLFVCLGNICFSPLAQAALEREAGQVGLDARIDSAGTGDWHMGNPPDERAQSVAKRHGIDISRYAARQVKPEDFHAFTHIVALDRENLANLERLRPADGTAELSLLLDHVEGRSGEAVADPYFGGDEGFETTWADVSAGAKALAQKLSGNDPIS